MSSSTKKTDVKSIDNLIKTAREVEQAIAKGVKPAEIRKQTGVRK
ncbi:MAG: hypothetical protein QW332_06045 [Thermoproteota archaeon]